jgi:mannosylfructose-phosphate synthase
MKSRDPRRIMMISTHGYVGAEPEFGKPDTGGQVVYLLELSKRLGRMGYRVDVLTRRFEDQPMLEPVDARVRIVRIPCGGREFLPKETLCEAIPEWVENAARWARSERLRYTLIDSHYWDAGLAGQSLSRRLAAPHIHTPHSIGSWKRDSMDGDAEELERKYNFRRRIRDEKTIYDECDLIVATTPTQRDILVGTEYDVSLEKIRVIPPGYDDERFFPVSLATRDALKRQLGLRGPIILALGRMAKNKGYDLLLRAMPVVFRRIEDAKLVLAVGSTEPSEAEREMIAGLHRLARDLGVEDRVVFKDFIPDDQLADHYRAADVFALSSRYEPFGMTAIEAMACGTPVVATTEGGLCEQVAWGIESLYANPFDFESFGHAIAFVLQNVRVAGQLSKFGPRKARASYTWSGVAQQLLASLESNREAGGPHFGRTAIGERAAEEALWSV